MLNRHHAIAVAVGVLAGAATAAIIGVPTDVIANPWFGREILVDGFDVAVLITLSVVTGALVSTYVIASGPTASAGRTGIGSGVLGWFAVGCPVCNKLVVALLGVSGASGWFASVQPLLGAVAVALAVAALVVRVRAIRRGTCALRSAQTTGREAAGPEDARPRPAA